MSSPPRWAALAVGQPLPPLRFPLTVLRLVMAAGANRDFNAIHHNTEAARAAGAADMYANTYFLQGMWERTVREFLGSAARLTALRGFAMHRFNTVGQVVEVSGHIARLWQDGTQGMVEIALQSSCDGQVTVGPGSITAALPLH